MGGFKALSLAGAFALSTVSFAAAADLPLAPALAPAPVVAPVDVSGWYLRADVGVGGLEQHNLRSTFDPNSFGGPAPETVRMHHATGDQALIGGGIGYQINNWFRADLTGEYRTAAHLQRGEAYTAYCPTGFCLDNYNSYIDTRLFLANAYADLGTWWGVTPYVGAGVGFADHHWSAISDVGMGRGFSNPRNKTEFAWAFMAGLGFNVTSNFKMDIGYRYVDMGRVNSNPIFCEDSAGCFKERQSMRLHSHDFRLGFRYAFVSASDPVVMAPLVRKY